MSNEVKARSLQEVMAEKGTPSLKAIAMAHELPPVRLYSVAKQPKEGEIYDAKVYNWDAIERFVARRFEEGAFTDFDQVIDAALKLDDELKLSDGRRTRTGGTAVEKKEIDGKLVQLRKHGSFEKDAGMFIVLKGDPAVYKIVYQTITHTVMVPVDDRAGTVTSNEVVIKSNGMLNYKGIAPTELDAAIDANFKAMAAAKAEKQAPADAAPVEAKATPQSKR